MFVFHGWSQIRSNMSSLLVLLYVLYCDIWLQFDDTLFLTSGDGMHVDRCTGLNGVTLYYLHTFATDILDTARLTTVPTQHSTFSS